MSQDEIDGDDALVRALRAPGSPSELAGEAEYLAAFRTAARPRAGIGLRRTAGRVGIGATTAVTVVALSAGVAAAYGRVLPEPVQRVAHGVLGPVGVPAPHHPRPHRATPTAGVATSPTATPTSTPRPTPSATAPTRTPQAAATAVPTGAATGRTPTASSAPTPTAGTTASPAVPAARVPAALTGTASSAQVAPGGAVTVTGVLTDDERRPVRRRDVRLVGRAAGQPWTTLAHGRTDKRGRVVLTTPALARTTGLQLRAGGGVHSPVLRVVVRPVLEVTATEADGTSSVLVTARGAQPGDRVTVWRRKNGRLVRVATVALGADGRATYAIPTPKARVRVVVRLPATRDHGQTENSVTLGPGPG